MQVFQTASERVESAGLAALGALTACISRSVLNSDSEDYLNVFLDLVLKGNTPPPKQIWFWEQEPTIVEGVRVFCYCVGSVYLEMCERETDLAVVLLSAYPSRRGVEKGKNRAN